MRIGKSLPIWFAVGLLGCLPAFARADNIAVAPAQLPQFDSEIQPADVQPHIEKLAGPEMRGRSGEEARRAADYLIAHFQSCGLSPLFGESFLQPIPGAKDDAGNSTTIGQNVGAILPGSDPALRDEYVIVSAHYDHLGVRNGLIYAGADDNSSGVSMLLEVARKLSAGPKPRRSIVFIGFDLEERLLWGSRWFAAHPPWPIERVKLFITADMIGRSLGNLDLDSIFVLGSEHAPRLKHTLDEVGLPKGLDVARLGIDLVGTRSDYGPFRDREIPFLFFSSGEHPDYHSPRDVPKRIDYEQVARVSGLVLRVTRNVADTDHAPVWTSDLKPDLDEAAALNRIAKLLIKADAGDKRFSDVQRMLVSHAENKTENILKRGVMTAAERTWLIRVSQVMLFSVL